MESLNEYTITYNEFPTHVPITRNKTAADKFIKINGQSIYNGNLQHYQRSIAVSWLHDYLSMNSTLEHLKSVELNYPIQLSLDLYVPRNYGTVKRRKGVLQWKPAKDDYAANWDADNQWIWTKVFQDTLQIMKVIPNDCVDFIRSVGPVTFIETSDLKDRKLVFKINCKL